MKWLKKIRPWAKRLFVLAASSTFAQTQTGFPNMVIEGQVFNNQSATFRSPESIISPSVSSQPVTVTGSSQVNFQGGERVMLMPGFNVSGLTSGGFFRGFIKKPDFTIYVISPSNPTTPVDKYKKLEVGFELPAYIANQVNSYLSGGSGLNPYDPDQISVEATFIHPAGSQRLIYGFYYKEFIRDLTASTPTWSVLNTPSKWRIRFAPNLVGNNWTCTVRIRVNGTLVPEESWFNFDCVNSSEKGYLEVGLHKRQFRFRDNHSSFYAIGQNIAWPNADWGNVANSQQFVDMMGWAQNISSNGGNYIRVIMSPWGHGVEWEKLGDYTSRQPNAWELDRLFEMSENNGLYIHLNLEMHGQYLIPPNALLPDEFTWLYNPYNSASAANGGVYSGVNYPLDVLSSADAKKYFKRRLRYIVSRWGYSTHLALYELLSEQDEWHNWDLNSDGESYLWHGEMANYIKSTLGDPHMVSTSFADRPYGTTYNLNNLDVTSIHKYARSRRQAFERWEHMNNNSLNNSLDGNLVRWNKPCSFGEMGFIKDVADPGDLEGCMDVNWHASLWSTAFMGGFGSGLNWWQWDNNTYRANNLPAISSFFNDVDFESNKLIYALKWPGGINVNGTNKNNYKLECFALRSWDKNRAIGWANNATTYWGNQSQMTNCPDRNGYIQSPPDDDDDYSFPIIISGEEVEIHELKLRKKYNVKWYGTRGSGGHLSQYDETKRTNIFGVLKPTMPVSGPGSENDYAFKAVITGQTFKDTDASIADTLICPDTIFVAGTYEDDIEGAFSYQWNFGNGLSSNEPHPSVYYDTPGNYQVSLIVTDTLGNKDTLVQSIVVLACDLDNSARVGQKEIVTQIHSKDESANAFGITIKPNPNSGDFNISLNFPFEEKIDIYIYDVQGKVIYHKRKAHERQHKVDMKEHPNGLYMIRVITSTTVEVEKIIKE